ncbi:Hypothetical_protein [Hexamita inflata]|uniref:Hypothetical_protein n=1 Tax=Hexamita inflata TaxID=28002 RepID=A0ABP1J664_9EUKA
MQRVSAFWDYVNSNTGDDICWHAIDYLKVEGQYINNVSQQGTFRRTTQAADNKENDSYIPKHLTFVYQPFTFRISQKAKSPFLYTDQQYYEKEKEIQQRNSSK